MAFTDYITAATTIVTSVFKPIMDFISEFVEDKDKRADLQAKVRLAEMQANVAFQQAILGLQQKLIENEAVIESGFYRNWRPALMWVVVLMVGSYAINNMIVWPIVNFYAPGAWPQLLLDWELVTLIGSITGAYVVGRTVEKVTQSKGGSK